MSYDEQRIIDLIDGGLYQQKQEQNLMKDTDLMPFGKYKGEQMEDVPADYLLWLKYDSKGKTIYIGSDTEKILLYIEDNLDVLNAEIKTDRNRNTVNKFLK